MMRVTNLTNSPYDIESKDGPKRVPAFGSVDGEFSGEYLDLLRATQAVKVEEIEAERPKAKDKR